MLFPGNGVARRRSVLGLSAQRIENLELGVDDLCVTRDQFADVFGGSQVGAAGAPAGGGPSAPSGSSARTRSALPRRPQQPRHQAPVHQAPVTIMKPPAARATWLKLRKRPPAAHPRWERRARTLTTPQSSGEPVPEGTPEPEWARANENAPTEPIPATGNRRLAPTECSSNDRALALAATFPASSR